MSDTDFLDDAGRASIATAILTSHHGLRRDLLAFQRALAAIARGDASRAAAVSEQWTHYRATLHGHHEAEDHDIFPRMRSAHPALAATIDQLVADHRRIDPLLEIGDRAFGLLPAVDDARNVVDELIALLDPHLAIEEREIIPHMRAERSFPAPDSDEMLALYAEGFAWSTHGIARDILAKLEEILPPALVARLPAARAAFAERFARAFGSADVGVSRTAIPSTTP